MIQQRKTDHLKICSEMNVQFMEKTTLLEDIHLIHEALPEIAVADVDTRTEFMGKALNAPLMISAMTGGMKEAGKFNNDLAGVAQDLGIAMTLGSQRPMLENNELISSYEIRQSAPDALILGNLGIQQAAAVELEEIEKLVTGINADGISVHLNAAMELSQKEGDSDFKDGYKTLTNLARQLPGKVMVKETGCGISRHVGAKLREAGIQVLDVAGAGGTSWTLVERLRSGGKPEQRSWMDEWGIPTAASLYGVSILGFELVGSGGVRNGLDVAKCLVLGADIAGMAFPVLKAHEQGGREGVAEFIKSIIDEFKNVMLLVGVRNISELKKHKPVFTGKLEEWMKNLR